MKEGGGGGVDADRGLVGWKHKVLVVCTVWFGNCGQEHVYLASVWMRRVGGWVELCVVLIFSTHQMAPWEGQEGSAPPAHLPATFIYLYYAGS